METCSASQLAQRKCIPCEGGVEPLTSQQAQSQLSALPNWQLTEDGRSISRKWKTADFVQAMKLLAAAADVAEQEQHHPDFHLTGYRHVQIDLTTHAIGGLSENDLILAAKIEKAFENLS